MMAGGRPGALPAAGRKGQSITMSMIGLQDWRGCVMDHGRTGKHKWRFAETDFGEGDYNYCTICGMRWDGRIHGR